MAAGIAICMLGMWGSVRLCARVAAKAGDRQKYLTGFWRSVLFVTGFGLAVKVSMTAGGALPAAFDSVAMGSLMFGVCMDDACEKVYCYVWWIALPAALGALLTGSPGAGFGEWLCFALLQYLLFARLYGRADCHAFAVCGLLFCQRGFGLKEDLLHMLASISLLALRQGLRKNITARGKLKTPVAFLPDIYLAFVLLWAAAL